MADPGERLDIVNEDDKPIGTASRRRVHEEALLHRAVHVLLVDGEGSLLVQRRSEQKRSYPGRWTSSASGHVPSGEPPVEAARREVREELGLEAPALEPIGKVRVEELDVGEREVTYVFAGRFPDGKKGALSPDPREVTEVRWVPIEQVVGSVRKDPDRWAGSFITVFDEVDENALGLVEGA